MARTGREKSFDKKSYAKQLEYLKNLDNPQRIRFLQRIQDPATRDKLADEIPGFSSWWKKNKNMPGGGREGGWFHKGTEGAYNVPTEPESVEAAREKALTLGQEGLSELLESLRTPYTSPVNQQMEQMFGHLKNPILQGILNPQHQNMPRGALFPDQIEAEYQQYQQQNPQQQDYQPSAMQSLMSALGNDAFQQHAVPWMNELKPQDLQQAYGYAEPYVNRALEGLGSAYTGMGNAYEGMGNMYQGMRNAPGNAYQGGQNIFNYLRDPRHGQEGSPEGESIPAYFGRRSLYGAMHPLESAQEYGRVLGHVGSMGISGIGSLLSKLGSYIPGRGQQPQQ